MTNVGKDHIERLPSGSYRVRVYAGTDPLTGKEIRLKATAETAEHAQAELARLLEQASVGQQPESAATVALHRDAAARRRIDLRNTAARLGHGDGCADHAQALRRPHLEVDRRAATYLSDLAAAARLAQPRQQTEA